jgi:hypothetical protein
VLGSPLVDLLEDVVPGARRQHATGAVFARRGEWRHLVTRPEQLLHVRSTDLLQRDHVRIEPAKHVLDEQAASLPVRVRRP